MNDQRDTEEIRARRRRAVRAALLLAVVAFMIYLGFILSGVLKAG